jgi:Mycobacterium membrane protein
MNNKLILIFFLATSWLFSCLKDTVTPASSRAVKYEITGNFTGGFTIAYLEANGSAEVAQITTLPWKKELTADNSVKAVTANATGSGGKSGQTATLKIYVGNIEVKAGSGTAISSGIISLAPQPHVF